MTSTFSPHVPLPSRAIDLFSLLNLIVLIIGLCFLQNRYFLMPGIPIDLPRENLAIEQNLPFASKLVIIDSEHFIFDGQISGRSEIAAALNGCDGMKKHCLLIFADRHSLLEDFLFVAKAAKECGFDSVQIASSSSRQN